MGFVGRKPTNAPLTSDDIPNGIIGAADLASGLSKLTFVTTVKTSGFTAVANEGYFCNTTSAAFTVTLPASPSAGDQIQLVDYAGTFDTNALTISPNGNKIEGSTSSHVLNGEREGVRLVYIDSTQGWLATSGINEGTDALSIPPYTVDFLVIAGGGGGGTGSNASGRRRGGGGGAGGYRNSFSTETSGGGGSSEASLSFNLGTVYTITVGAGGNGATNDNSYGSSGASSSISGTGISTITSSGGGSGASESNIGTAGGSGGGGGALTGTVAGGAGTANQGFAGGSGASNLGGGGGGAGEAGNTDGGGFGGDGLSSSITGSSTARGGGGGGGDPATIAAGTGGGGNAGASDTNGSNGSANTGGGGGGSGDFNTISVDAGNGGSGVVILRMPDANYSGTTTGSPTVNTNVGGTGETVIIFNSSGSITG